jgi:hypothetical protein
MDFPQFDGSNPEEWLRLTEKYFGMVYVPEIAKFDYAQLYITGRADTWLRNSGVLEEELTWKQFCEAMVQRFNYGSSYEAVEEFNSVKQGYSSVSEYTNKFEDKMANYRKENPEVKEAYYIKCYINGLRGEIKHYMKPLKPANLYEVVVYAKDMEKGMLATAQSHNRRLNTASGNIKPGFSSQFQSKQRPLPDQATPSLPYKKEQETICPKPEAKFNEPGVCKYCGQKWFFGHHCQQYKCLNLMAAEETTESEDEQFHDTSPEEPPDSNTAQMSEDNKLMQISVQAVRGHPANNTFTLPVLIAGKTAIALVDTGSTHTFMDLKFSTKIKCTTTSNSVVGIWRQ